jgi:hypothetical protein
VTTNEKSASQATAELPKLPEPRPIEGAAGRNSVRWGLGYTADQMNAHYLAGVEAGRASRAQSEWIGVETRLPDSSRRVLACNPIGYVGAATYANGHWNGIGGASGWMELPKPIATTGETK